MIVPGSYRVTLVLMLSLRSATADAKRCGTSNLSGDIVVEAGRDVTIHGRKNQGELLDDWSWRL